MKTLTKVLGVSAVLAVLGTGAALARMGGHGGMMGPGPEGMYEHMCSDTHKPWDPAKMAEHMTKKLALTDAQKPLFAEFHNAMSKSHDDVKVVICSDKPDLATAPGRAAFEIKSLEAHLSSMKAVQPKLEVFYASLTDAQKKIFDDLRPHHGWHHDGEHHGRHHHGMQNDMDK
jgi:periplasmic protein CpxP/Spy